MKKLHILLLLLLIGFCPPAQIRWTPLKEAFDDKSNGKKPVIMYFYDSESEAEALKSQFLESKTATDFINSQFIAVKLDVRERNPIDAFGRKFVANGKGYHGFANYLSITASPGVLFFNAEKKPLMILYGALTAQEIQPYLQKIAADDHKISNGAASWRTPGRKLR